MVEDQKPKNCSKIILVIPNKKMTVKRLSTLRWEWSIAFQRAKLSVVETKELIPVNVRVIKNCSGKAIGGRNRLKRKKRNRPHICTKAGPTTGKIGVEEINKHGHLLMDTN